MFHIVMILVNCSYVVKRLNLHHSEMETRAFLQTYVVSPHMPHPLRKKTDGTCDSLQLDFLIIFVHSLAEGTLGRKPVCSWPARRSHPHLLQYLCLVKQDDDASQRRKCNRLKKHIVTQQGPSRQNERALNSFSGFNPSSRGINLK